MAAVIATAVVPTLIANALSLPTHPIPIAASQEEAAEVEEEVERGGAGGGSLPSDLH